MNNVLSFIKDCSAGIHLFNFNNKNTRIWNLFKANIRDSWTTSMMSSGIVIVIFEQISHIAMLFSAGWVKIIKTRVQMLERHPPGS